MKTRFDTSQYRDSHGAEPRGRGSWAFTPVHDAWADDSRIIWCKGTYIEAKREARELARIRRYLILYVLP